MKLSEELEMMSEKLLSERAKKLESIATDHWMSEAFRWGATYDRAVAYAEEKLKVVNES
jgi:hypothetical protein